MGRRADRTRQLVTSLAANQSRDWKDWKQPLQHTLAAGLLGMNVLVLALIVARCRAEAMSGAG
jgi:hypothetical protein